MPLTVSDIERELLTRVGPYLVRVGLDGTTAGGANASLRSPIRGAAWAIGLVPADPIAVADADVADVVGFGLEKLLDVAELKALELCWGNWPEVDQQAGDESQDLSQLADRLERRIKFLTERVSKPCGPVAGIGLIPGPSASGLIRAGRFATGVSLPWDWPAWRACR